MASPKKNDSLSFPVVAIGASAGGLAAFEAFFSGMPTDEEIGMAFVIVQHLSPDHKSILSELIGRYTRMKVTEAEDGIVLEPNRAYIIPPNRDLQLDGQVLRLHEARSSRGPRLTIDYFFRSVADSQRERGICIVLSGTGTDGTMGVRAIKGEGGMVMAQSPESTEHDGMPRSAIATGMVDYVLAPADMPPQLLAYTRHAFGNGQEALYESSDSTLVKSLTTLLRAQTGHDFSQYKTTTLVRRMQRRMALHQIETPAEYAKFARENSGEVDALFRDLLIGVTNFFRDAEAYKVLEEKVIPRLLASKSAHDPVRVWTCGCSTGEEAYSLAILFQEQIDAQKRPFKLQLFATDLDRNAIESARTGVFPASIAADVSPERLARFFTHDAERDVYRVHKVIRDLLVFSEQDVIKDPPFSKLDLITCRNLMIYLNADVQRKLIPLFHYAINPGGYLFLGNSETVGEFSRLFAPIDRKWKVYSRELIDSGIARNGFPEFTPPSKEDRVPGKTRAADPVSAQVTLRHLAEQTLLAHYAEAGILINGRGDILYIMGRTGRYLEPASGDPTLNVQAMAREGLRRELTTALHKVVAQRQPIQYRGLKIKADGVTTVADLTVRPVHASAEFGPTDLYLVVLQESLVSESGSEHEKSGNGDGGGRVARLEHELRAKEDYLQTTLEEMETTNEELKSTNEEMQSVNEELQSTNEELETSKEELQSVNEELSTVNAELQDKVADLSRANNDMNNLLAGTGVGTVFVDHQLRISRFTPSATQVINLIPGDVGRPVEHVASNLVGYNTLSEDLQQVLSSLVPKEAEVCTKAGVWYLMRLRPYRTISNVIEGAVLTFVDISERKRVEEALAASDARFQSIFDRIQATLAQMDASGRFVFVNNHQCQLVGYTREELLQMRIQELLSSEDASAFARGVADLETGRSDFDFPHRQRSKDGSERLFRSNVSAIRNRSGRIESVVAISMDTP